ncbi:hypothetical protein KC343_g10294 [Hortaea werneckii]|nr:hypothetical protein KC352_g17515 [Hortaea werneckii]KAI7558158.1 hypothetical protein KC317_g11179 [Hortaea werneckii]KAI7613228.1 hypothetical protein KC346_g7424 [Hortaea werneckii]KAI7614958.1 hypothetical protein KC343_g10294 [Hortaea werneckii]KAI7644868.1 hypothetical protein KC319_g12181 [Hortaea werneckii]
MKKTMNQHNSFPERSKPFLLSLPPELRIQIFGYVLRSVSSRRPFLALDGLFAECSTTTRPLKRTAILSVCRTTFNDSIDMLYDLAAVEISIGSSRQFQEGSPASLDRLGALEDSQLLRNLRHLELEVMYDGSRLAAIERVASRIRRLAAVLNEAQKLKTLTVSFFDCGRHVSHDVMAGRQHDEPVADKILDAAMLIQCKRLLGVDRNMASRDHMGNEKWTELRGRMEEGEDQESFREINHGYWDQAGGF